jgi:hypothetical protein
MPNVIRREKYENGNEEKEEIFKEKGRERKDKSKN